MTPAWFAAAVAAMAVCLFVAGLIIPPRDPIALLRARYFDLARLSRAEGSRELDARVDGLTRKFPGKTYAWYLQWLVRDLERAKK